MSVSLGLLAERHGCELLGEPGTKVDHVVSLQAGGEGGVTFFADQLFRAALKKTTATAVILTAADADACPVAALVTTNPYLTFARIAAELHPPPQLDGTVHPTAVVADDCAVPESCQISAGAVIEGGVTLGERCYVGPNCVIGRGSVIGSDTRLLAGVLVYHQVSIGDHCLVHSGSVLGSDGFGNAREESGSWVKVPQTGRLIIGDDVEIGANCTIDRGAIGDTEICSGARLDNLVHVGHNVSIGYHTAVAGLCGFSGSVHLGDRCMVGGTTAFAGHISITDDVMILGGSTVTSSIKKSGMYGGPGASAEEVGQWRKNVVRIRQLDDIARRLRRLERKIENTDK